MSKMFDTLYKRAKNGKIVSYLIKALDGNPPIIRKFTGYIDGEKTYHEEEISVGKQKRTAYQQAEFQAESDWKKKKDEGYKSLEDLNLHLSGNKSYYVLRKSDEELSSVGYATLEIALDKVLSKYNTDASGNVKPMLAHEAKKRHEKGKLTFPMYAQPKLDGMRCLIIKQGDNIRAISRAGKPITVITEILDEVVLLLGDSDEILDGELYSDEISFQDIISACKKRGPNTVKLNYRVYDLVQPDKGFAERLTDLDSMFECHDQVFIHRVETGLCMSWEEAKQLHDNFVEQGHEGLMLRTIQGGYEAGPRSYTLLKYKDFDDEEFEFVRWEKGQREEDLVAKCYTKGGRVFRAKMMGTVSQKQEMEKQSPKVITCKFFGWTDSEIPMDEDKLNATGTRPRFPIGKAIRDDNE